MSSPTPSRASSKSPTRNPNNPTRSSPRNSPHASPKRTPLLERSDSQKNAAYRQSPFPTLSSQVFPPKADPYAFGDELPTVRPSPTLPARSPKRPSQSSQSSWSFYTTAESPLIPESPQLRDFPPLFSALPSPEAAPAAERQESTSTGRVRRRTLTSSAAKSSESSTTVEGASSGVDTGESSKMGAQLQPLRTRLPEGPRSTESFASRSRHQKGSSDSSAAGAIPHHKSVERLRSQSSLVFKSKRRAQPGQSDSPRSSDERPRSSSSPSTPTDAFIQALINSGTNVQYPKLRKPSATSLRSESIMSGGAYPPPLRLQRKRANSQLAKTASIAPESLEPRSDDAESSIMGARLRPAPSQASFLTQTSDGSTAWDLSHPSYAIGQSHWTDEIDDTVTELHPRSLKRQKSDLHMKSLSRSTQTSRESLRSSVGSFYHFLNDSRTAWAHAYYRGDGRLRLETPPNMEPVGAWETPNQQRRTTSSSTHTESPASAGFPDKIYVPRVRPFARGPNAGHRTNDVNPSRIRHVPPEDSSSSPYNTTQTDSSIIPRARPFAKDSSSPIARTDTDSSAIQGPSTFFNSSSSPYNTTETEANLIPPHMRFISENNPLPRRGTGGDSSSLPQIRSQALGRDFSIAPSEDPSVNVTPSNGGNNGTHMWSRVFNPTPEVPHLSPNKRVGPWMPYWRAPSFDESSSIFDKSNLQLMLFCVGFLFPPAWWIAAFLPLPERPQWERGNQPAHAHASKEQSNDLFNSIDVHRFQKTRWWRNLNRFMALAGVLIVAAVVACVVVATT